MTSGLASAPSEQRAMQGFRAVPIDEEILVKLRRDAALLDTTVPRLINRLLEAIAADRLVRAVLDEG